MTEIKERGLGFKDLQAFNKALLAKKVWRFPTTPNLLVSKIMKANFFGFGKIMKAKYYPNTSILKAQSTGSASWIWQSFQSAIPMIERGSRKNVGDGASINVREDRWIPKNGIGKVSSSKPENCEVMSVKRLIKNQQWDVEALILLFTAEESMAMQSISLIPFGGKDHVRWNHLTSGIYTVKTGYDFQKSCNKRRKAENQDSRSSSREASKPQMLKDLWDSVEA